MPMRLTIEKIIYPGKSLARLGRKIVLTDKGLPGEIVEAVIVKEKKNYAEAKTSAVVTASPNRIQPRCDHYEACSLYQDMDYQLQTKIKQGQIEEIFSHHLKITRPPFIFRPSPNIWHYRNKIDLHIIWAGSKPYPAYNLPHSQKQLIKIKGCFLVSRQINEFIEALMKIMADKQLKFINGLAVKESACKKQLLLILYGDNIKKAVEHARCFEPLLKQFPLKGIVSVDKNTSKPHIMAGSDFIEERIDETIFHIGAESFFQVNTGLLSQMIKDMQNSLSLTGRETIADLYCGTGTFGIILSPLAKRIISVELLKENIYFLKRNIQINNIQNFTVCREDCGQWLLKNTQISPDILIVDPPRKGLDASICSSMIKKSIPRAVYVSCNPVTLARDLKILLSAYTLKNFFIYDFFPHTPHIETLSIMEIK